MYPHQFTSLRTSGRGPGPAVRRVAWLFNSFTILALLAWTISGCSNVQNIRPVADTPNFQKTLTVMSFNIRHGCGREQWGNASSAFFKGCPKKLDPVISAIRSADPDVVGLQEVSSSQAGEIARTLNMNYAYSAHNSTGYGHWWGNAVLSRFQILESQTTAIGGSAGRNRSIVTAIALVKGTPTAFISVHTDHRLADERSVKKILHHIDTMSRPTVLIGDFNMLPLDPRTSLITREAGFIDSAGSRKPDQMMGTWDSPSDMRIDYVFVQPKYFKVLDAALVTDEHHDASDHIAYYAKIKWKQ